MRRELKVPLQSAGVGVEREDRVRVQVVALPLVAVVIGTGVAGRPVQQARVRIVGACQPGSGTSMLECLADPCFGSRFAAGRDRPEPPHAFAARRPVGIEKSAIAFIAARHAGDHQIVDHERRARAAIVLAIVRHLGIPQKLSSDPVERDQVGVIGLEKDTIPENRHAAIDAARGIADQALRSRPGVVPDLTARARIERPDGIDGRHVHQAVDDDWRDLKRAGRAWNLKGPFRREPRHIGDRDLVERAVAVAAQLSMIGRPFARLRPSDVAKARALASCSSARQRRARRSIHGKASEVREQIAHLVGRRLHGRHRRRLRCDLCDLTPGYGLKSAVETLQPKVERALGT